VQGALFSCALVIGALRFSHGYGELLELLGIIQALQCEPHFTVVVDPRLWFRRHTGAPGVERPDQSSPVYVPSHTFTGIFIALFKSDRHVQLGFFSGHVRELGYSLSLLTDVASTPSLSMSVDTSVVASASSDSGDCDSNECHASGGTTQAVVGRVGLEPTTSPGLA
jgi:hypothetical protein